MVTKVAWRSPKALKIYYYYTLAEQPGISSVLYHNNTRIKLNSIEYYGAFPIKNQLTLTKCPIKKILTDCEVEKERTGLIN